MTFIRYTIVLCGVLACCVTASAQTPVDQQLEKLSQSHKIVYIDGRPSTHEEEIHDRDSIAVQILNYYYDQFRNINDPASPYFQFMSRDGKLSMGIGGCVRMRAYYDFHGTTDSPAFSPYLIPIPADPARRNAFGTTPAGSTIFFQLFGDNKVFGHYTLYIECNFNGYKSRDFHLKKAYAQFRDFTVGYAPSTFSDPAALPPMVESNGPANKIASSNVLVRYMPTIKKRWVLAVSVESASNPANYSVTDSTCRKVSNWSPDFCAFVQYQWAHGQHVRLSGMYRMMPYRNELQGRNHTVSGWGLLLSAVGRPVGPLTLYGSTCYGHGYTSVLNDLLMGQYDLLQDPDQPGKMYSPAAMGWNVGAQYNFLPNLFASISGGQVHYYPLRQAPGSEYKWGFIGAVNMFWNPTPRSQVGIEYDIAHRRNRNGAGQSASRIGAMVQFSF